MKESDSFGMLRFSSCFEKLFSVKRFVLMISSIILFFSVYLVGEKF